MIGRSAPRNFNFLEFGREKLIAILDCYENCDFGISLQFPHEPEDQITKAGKRGGGDSSGSPRPRL